MKLTIQELMNRLEKAKIDTSQKNCPPSRREQMEVNKAKVGAGRTNSQMHFSKEAFSEDSTEAQASNLTDRTESTPFWYDEKRGYAYAEIWAEEAAIENSAGSSSKARSGTWHASNGIRYNKKMKKGRDDTFVRMTGQTK